MSQWVDSGIVALILGTVFFIIIFVPGLVWQYRRYGSWSLPRMLGLAAVCIYFTALFTYTFMPFPDPSKITCVGANMTPGSFIVDSAKYLTNHSVKQFLTSAVFLQIGFNVVLFIPLGIILRSYFNCSIFISFLGCLAATVLIEISQVTGLWGLYACPYRVGDIDDIITNAMGGFIGIIIAPLILWWMPGSAELEARRFQPRPVTATRRWVGMLIDLSSWFFVIFLVELVGQWLDHYLHLQHKYESWISIVASITALLTVFILPALFSRGGSFGQSCVWLTPRWGKNNPYYQQRIRKLIRSLIVSGPVTVHTIFEILGKNYKWLGLACLIIVLLSIIMVPMTSTFRSLSGLITGDEMVDARTLMRNKYRETH